MPVIDCGVADMDRFATLFSPATPPATPTHATAAKDEPPTRIAAVRPRKSTQSSADSDFGVFVSVPPSQDPLSHVPNCAGLAQPASLVYFDRFTANARTAVERNKREVLDELLQHEDDPMYFLDTHSTPPLTLLHTDPSAVPIPIPLPTSTDDALAEALASDMSNPKFIRFEGGGSVKVSLSPAQSRLPLAPHLTGNASPPSTSSPSASTTSLPASFPTSSPPSSASTLASGSSTLSRLSSSLVSFLPPSRPRSRTRTAPATPSSSAPSTLAARAHSPVHFASRPSSTTAAMLTHGSPFSSTPYVPPTGAPGFAGDRAWDRGFSEVLAREEKRGLVDTTGLGPAHARHGRGMSVSLLGRREGTVRVLTEDMADLIRPQLPALTKLPRSWTLLYSLDQHGISLNTLYARCEPRVPSRAHPGPPKGGLLVVQDAQDAVFGAWMSEGIRLEKGGYYGSGESFLWRYHPPGQGDPQGRLDVHKWTGANDYVALCEPGFISFGGGDGRYGLYLDASLLDGSSAPCPTFGNPPLCAARGAPGNGVVRARGEVLYECVGLEVWGIGPG